MRSLSGSSQGSLAVTAGAVLALFTVLALVAVSRGGDDTIRINEIVSSQAYGLVDGYGAHPDWIEIHNGTGDTVSLEGWGLADRDDPSDPWWFPPRSMEPDEHLVVFASGRDGPDPDGHLHSDFRLDRDGEAVVLVDPDGNVVDRAPPVRLDRNHSLGRDPHDSSRWCRFLHPTPGTPNGPVCWDDERMGAPALSVASGFYDDPIEVEISPTGGADEVWYTLDGSYPDLDENPDSTHVYERPIRVEDRTPEPNHLSTISVSLDPDLVDSAHQTHVPQDPVPKATVIRTRPPHGGEVVATYFIGDHHRREALPVLSLSLDEGYLFDERGGIFMPGETFERFLEGPNFNPAGGWGTPANWTQRGRQWERPLPQDSHRPVWMQWCESDRGCVYEVPLGVRVHGGASRSFPRKSLRLYARTEYGTRPFTHPFFDHPGPNRHHRLILRNSGNDHGRALMADAYLQSLMGHFEADTQAARPTVVYMNGEYWGIFNLRERYDRHYLAENHGADPDTVVILDFAHLTIESGDPSEVESYARLIDFLEAPGLDGTAIDRRIDSTIDTDSFFDFLIANVFIANSDWLGNNAAAWRQPLGPGDGGSARLDGRWRWLINDLDAFGGSRRRPELDVIEHRLQVDEGNPHYRSGIPFLFDRLMARPAYRQQFLNRFADHLNTTFAPDRSVAELDRMEALLAPEVPSHVARWSQPATVDEWHDHVAHLRTFMIERPDHQWQQLIDHFDLAGTVPVSVRHEAAAGEVRVNSIELVDGYPGVGDPSDWRGRYFVGVPIELEAVPAEGFRFVRWQGLDGAVAELALLQWSPDRPIELRAVFEPIGG